MNFKINSRPFFTIILKIKNDNLKTRDFSPHIERVLAVVHGIILKIVGFQDCLKQFMLAAVIFVMDVALLSLLPMYIHRHFLTERIVHNGATLLVCYEK